MIIISGIFYLLIASRNDFLVISAEYDIRAVGIESEAVACGFVQRALPKLTIGIGVPAQAFALYPETGYVEYTYLLTGE